LELNIQAPSLPDATASASWASCEWMRSVGGRLVGGGNSAKPHVRLSTIEQGLNWEAALSDLLCNSVDDSERWALMCHATALAGSWIQISAGAQLDEPIVLLPGAGTSNGLGVSIDAIEVGRDARVQLVEVIDSAFPTARSVRIKVGARSMLHHTRLILGSSRPLLIETTRVDVMEEGRYLHSNVSTPAPSSYESLLVRLLGHSSRADIATGTLKRARGQVHTGVSVQLLADDTLASMAVLGMASDPGLVISTDVGASRGLVGAGCSAHIVGMSLTHGATVQLRPTCAAFAGEINLRQRSRLISGLMQSMSCGAYQSNDSSFVHGMDSCLRRLREKEVLSASDDWWRAIGKSATECFL